MTYDCFSFFDELDLLEIRLNILSDYVDYFIITESETSFAGKSKKLYFKENFKRFDKWINKIIYHNPAPFPTDTDLYEQALKSQNTGNKEYVWLNEFYQKESMIKELKNANDNDIIFISDLDEIWNPKLNIQIVKDEIYRPIQKCYPFYLNNLSDQEYGWTGTRVANYKTVKQYGLNHIRTEAIAKSIPIENGGWHFTWLNKKQNKWEDNHPDNYQRLGFYTNSKMHKDESYLPDYLITNKEKWKHLFLD